MDIVEIISNVGFPIAICLIFVIGFKYMFDKFMTKSDEESKEHAEEISSMVEALNNNTLVLQKLCDKLDGMETEEPVEGASDER